RAFFAVSRARVIRSRASARETFGRVSACSSSKISSRRDSPVRMGGTIGGGAFGGAVGGGTGGLGARGSPIGGGGGDRSSSDGTSMPLASRAAARYLSASIRLFSFP